MEGEAMILENADVRVAIDPLTGGFASIHNKRLAKELVSKGTPTRLFRIIAPDGPMLCRHLDSEAPQMSQEAGAVTLRFETSDLRATARLSLDGLAIVATLEITNTGRLAFEELQFPCLLGLSPIEGARYTVPSFGKRSFDPFGPQFGGDHRNAEQYMHKLASRYPGRMVTAWSDYSSPAHGVGLEARHTDFSLVDFFVAKTIDKKTKPFARSLDLSATFPRRLAPGETWQSPPMRIFLHEGDWRATADAHREWVASWIVKPERIAKFVESVGWHYFFLKHQDGSSRFSYADLPRMAEASLSAGCPYLLLFGWHEGGHDNHYFYRYVPNREWGGEEGLRAAVARAKELGAELIPFFNGTLANVNMPEHQAFGHRWEVRSRENAPNHAGDWTGFTVDGPGTDRERMHHEICPCAEQQEYFLETMRRIVRDYGFGNIQLDQISIKNFPCYNDSHGHSHPDRAPIDGFARLLDETRAFVRRECPGGMLLAECTNEFTGQWTDGAWTWDFLEDVDPILYSAPWLLTSTSIDAEEYAEANRAFTHKIMFDLRIKGGDELITEYPEFADHVRRLASLKRRVAPYFAWADFRGREGIVALEGENADAIVAVSYRTQDGAKSCIALAEKNGAAARASLTLAWKSRDDTVRIESSHAETARASANGPIAITLAPYEAQVICLDG